MPARTQKPKLKTKPKKPSPTFPLTPHPNGQWCKKIRGKVHFFGVWADSQTALDRYHAGAEDLHAGRTPRVETLSTGETTGKDAFNACHKAVDRIKEVVPIWKKEVYQDGSRWVACEAHEFPPSDQSPLEQSSAESHTR